MKLLPITSAFLFFTLFLSLTSQAQNGIDSTISKDTQFELVNDTLVSASGLKIYPGQKFILGNPAGANGRYRAIISKYAALVPNIWGKNNGYENMIENYVSTKKSKKQVEALAPGQVYTLGKIGKGGKKQFQFYFTMLLSDTNDYQCDILLALRLKELVFQ